MHLRCGSIAQRAQLCPSRHSRDPILRLLRHVHSGANDGRVSLVAQIHSSRARDLIGTLSVVRDDRALSGGEIEAATGRQAHRRGAAQKRMREAV